VVCPSGVESAFIFSNILIFHLLWVKIKLSWTFFLEIQNDGIFVTGEELELPPALNLGANCMFSKFKIKIHDKLYLTKVTVY
jgi:hypothetical protein